MEILKQEVVNMKKLLVISYDKFARPIAKYYYIM